MDLAAALLLSVIASPTPGEICGADAGLKRWTPEIGGGAVTVGEDAKAAAKRHEEAAYAHVYAERRCEAVVEMRRAYAAHPDAAFLFNVATAYALWPGHCPEAVDHLQRYLAACPACAQADAARGRLAELQRHCPQPEPSAPTAPAPPPAAAPVTDRLPAPAETVPPPEATPPVARPPAQPDGSLTPWILAAAGATALGVGLWAATRASKDSDRFNDLEDDADPQSDQPLRPQLQSVSDDYDQHRLTAWAALGTAGALAAAAALTFSW